MNNKNFKELEKILNSKWRFFGTKNNEEIAEVSVDNEFICDLDNNFINIFINKFNLCSKSATFMLSNPFL